MIGGFFGRAVRGAVRGAAGGAVAGGISGGGDIMNIAGGAAMGALGGGIGGHYFGGMRAANIASRGLKMARRGSVKAQSAAFNRFKAGGGDKYIDIALGAKKMTGMIDTARGYIGKNRAMVNKYGGHAASIAGIASAGYIGSSMINANRGY